MPSHDQNWKFREQQNENATPILAKGRGFYAIASSRSPVARRVSMKTQTDWARALGVAALLLGSVVAVIVFGLENQPAGLQELVGLDPATEDAETPTDGRAHGIDGEVSEALDAGRHEVVTAATRTEYELLDMTDAPVVGATFVLFESGVLLQKGETDSQGRFSAEESGEGVSDLLVMAANFAPQVLKAPREAGLHVLHLAQGAVLSGRVTVDGKRPADRLLLTLDSDRLLLDFEAELGLTCKQAGLDSWVESAMEVKTAADGTFLFQGLSADWSGGLKAPRAYQLKDRTLARDPWWTTMELDRPVVGLLFELTKPLRIIGRVVSEEGGEPVAGASIYPTLSYADGSTNRYLLDDEIAGEDGRFECLLASANLLGTSLKICPPDHMIERVIPIETAHLTSDLDLGDIALRVGRGRLQLDLLIQDRGGIPIEGATAIILDAAKRTSAPTDESGRTVIGGLAEGPTMLRALAIGYELEDVPCVVGPEGGELVVTMRKSTLLRLRFMAADGTALRSVSCVISTDEYPFEQRITYPTMLLMTRMGASHQMNLDRGDGITMMHSSTTQASGERQVVVSGIRPGLPMRLTLASRMQYILENRDLLPLLPEEHRDVDIVLEKTPRAFRVRVVDEQGEPLPQADVSVSHPSLLPGVSSGFGQGGTKSGEYEFREVFDDSLDVRAHCPGYIPFHDPALEIPIDGSVVEIQLLEGRDVNVTVKDTDGNPLRASIMARLPNGAASMASVLKRGHFLLRGLPETSVSVMVQMGTSKTWDHAIYKRELAGKQSELHLVFPVAGRIEGQALLPGDLDPQALCRVVLTSEDLIGARAFMLTAFNPGTFDFEFENVVSGEYKICLQQQDRSQLPKLTFENVGGESELAVEPGQTTLVDLRP